MPNGRGDSDEREIPRPFALLTLGVAPFAALLLAASLITWPIVPVPQLLLVLLAAVLAETAAISLPGGGTQSLSYPLALCALVLLGPSAAALVAAISTIQLPQLRAGRRGLIITLFNASQVLVAMVLSGLLYESLGGRFLIARSELQDVFLTPFTSVDFPRMLLALVMLAIASYLLNAILATLGLAALHRIALRRIWSPTVIALVPSQLALAFLGYGMAQVLALSGAGFILFILPLVISRQVFQQYLALREAYLDSVTALVAAIEAKDVYTCGHSHRVAVYATEIARELGYADEQVERVERSALLHDLGKVAVRNEILNKPTFLTPDERLVINEHPAVGSAIAGRIPYLSDLERIIACHHERYDGEGYCEGLSGEQIPWEARILAVADAFDAMTSVRAYRSAMDMDAAVAEIRAGRGSQFDPTVVDAFLRVRFASAPDGQDTMERAV